MTLSSDSEASRFRVGSDRITLDNWHPLTRGDRQLVIEPSASRRVAASRAAFEDLMARDVPIYGVTTGYGARSSEQIPAGRLNDVQLNTVLSHAVGVGPAVSEVVARGALLLKIRELCDSYSAVTPALVEHLVDCFNASLLPVIPSQGSVSASGDLVPHAHLALMVIGVGPVRLAGAEIAAEEALSVCGLHPYELGPKEGLALVNGTGFSTALAMEVLTAADLLLGAASLAVSLSLQVLRGAPDAFDSRVVAARPHPGARSLAAVVRHLSEGSGFLAARDTGRIHDAYCLRAAPQVYGACADAFEYASSSILIEANSWTDNPLVLASGEVLSGGNFHAEPVGIPVDSLAIALCEVAALSQARIQKLIDCPYAVGLPPKLTRDPDFSLGMSMFGSVVAALVAECRTLAMPASIETATIDAAEDHVSMAAIAGRKALRMAQLVSRVLAVELLAACQAADLTGIELLSENVRDGYRAVREISPELQGDRPLGRDIDELASTILLGEPGRLGSYRWRTLTKLLA